MISKNDAKHIAALARIHLREEEADSLSKDLEKILDYVKTLEGLDVTDIEPTSHVLDLTNVSREDEAKPSLTQEEVLGISVEQANGSFKVPKVIE